MQACTLDRRCAHRSRWGVDSCSTVVCPGVLNTHGQGFSVRFYVGLVVTVRLVIVRRDVHLLLPADISGVVVVSVLLHGLRVRIAARIVQRVIERGLLVDRPRPIIVRSPLLDGLRGRWVRTDRDSRADGSCRRGGDVAHDLIVGRIGPCGVFGGRVFVG